MIDLTSDRRTAMKHILLLEDDAALGQGIRFALEQHMEWEAESFKG